jgi:hypothetical protein
MRVSHPIVEMLKHNVRGVEKDDVRVANAKIM